MKSDDQVLDEATVIVENQWCQGSWYESVTDRYCAMGAVERAVGISNEHIDELGSLGYGDGVSKAEVEQVQRAANRLAHVILDQYPAFPAQLKEAGFKFDPTTITESAVEVFNDTHTREEMVAIFEKARHS